jgi:hypothetical protein
MWGPTLEPFYAHAHTHEYTLVAVRVYTHRYTMHTCAHTPMHTHKAHYILCCTNTPLTRVGIQRSFVAQGEACVCMGVWTCMGVGGCVCVWYEISALWGPLEPFWQGPSLKDTYQQWGWALWGFHSFSTWEAGRGVVSGTPGLCCQEWTPPSLLPGLQASAPKTIPVTALI